MIQGKGNVGDCSAEFTKTRDQTMCGMSMAMINYGRMDLTFMVALMGKAMFPVLLVANWH